MVAAVVGATTAGIAGVIGVVITQTTLDGQTTTTWSAGTIAITFLIPLLIAAAVGIGILKMVGNI